MTVAIFGIDGDEVRLGQVGIAVGEIGVGVVNIVRHPSEGRRSVQLNVAELEGRFFLRILVRR